MIIQLMVSLSKCQLNVIGICMLLQIFGRTVIFTPVTGEQDIFMTLKGLFSITLGRQTEF